VGLLDGSGGGLLLLLDLVFVELVPQLFELSGVLVQVVRVVHDEQVLLIVRASLEGPVERSGQEECIVNQHELVVHVVLLSIVSAGWDASIGQRLDVVALVLHALVVGDHAHVDAGIVTFDHGIGEHVIGEVEHTDQEALAGLLDVALELVDVLLVGEKEGVEVAGLWSVQVFLDLSDQLAETIQDSLVSVVLHLFGGVSEKHVDSG
jgi:hypothetical protein